MTDEVTEQRFIIPEGNQTAVIDTQTRQAFHLQDHEEAVRLAGYLNAQEDIWRTTTQST